MIISPLPSRLPAAPAGAPALVCKTLPRISPASAPPRGRRGLRGMPRPGTPFAPPSLEACPETQFFHCPPVSSPFGKPRGGRGRRAGPLPPGALPPRLPSHAAGMRGGMRQFPEVDPLPCWSTAAHISPGGSSPPSLKFRNRLRG